MQIMKKKGSLYIPFFNQHVNKLQNEPHFSSPIYHASHRKDGTNGKTRNFKPGTLNLPGRHHGFDGFSNTGNSSPKSVRSAAASLRSVMLSGLPMYEA